VLWLARGCCERSRRARRGGGVVGRLRGRAGGGGGGVHAVFIDARSVMQAAAWAAGSGKGCACCVPAPGSALRRPRPANVLFCFRLVTLSCWKT
jgi:hypothetical protein